MADTAPQSEAPKTTTASENVEAKPVEPNAKKSKVDTKDAAAPLPKPVDVPPPTTAAAESKPAKKEEPSAAASPKEGTPESPAAPKGRTRRSSSKVGSETASASASASASSGSPSTRTRSSTRKRASGATESGGEDKDKEEEQEDEDDDEDDEDEDDDEEEEDDEDDEDFSDHGDGRGARRKRGSKSKSSSSSKSRGKGKAKAKGKKKSSSSSKGKSSSSSSKKKGSKKSSECPRTRSSRSKKSSADAKPDSAAEEAAEKPADSGAPTTTATTSTSSSSAAAPDEETSPSSAVSVAAEAAAGHPDHPPGRAWVDPSRAADSDKYWESGDVASPSDRENTDFGFPAKKPGQLKIVSWNVAGYSAVCKKGFADYITKEDPDIICLQETKIAEKPGKAIAIPSLPHKFFCTCEDKAGYSGTAIFSKVAPVKVTCGMGIPDHDSQGRLITAEFNNFFMVCTYVPNASRGLVNLESRMQWDIDFLAYLKKLEATKPVVWCGDLNVAHLWIDIANPKSNSNKSAGFTYPERDSFTKILDAGFVDSYRHFFPKKRKFYTFWTYTSKSREKDVGWRLDYFIVSKGFMPNVEIVWRRAAVLGSDHCPLCLLLNSS
ncbi:recombination repair protein 1 [Pelomyxa schiedti]|nr:recombination repair protein 1 [Pelomyxa schiedti]